MKHLRWLLFGLLVLTGHVMADDARRIVVGFPPGGSLDVLARGVAQSMTEASGQTVIVINQPGAGSLIAAQAVANAQPDGRTILIAPVVVPAFMPHLYRKLSFDPLNDLVPVAELGTFNFALVVGSNVPVKTLAEWIAYCKANPRKVQFGSLGAGTPSHFLGVMLNRAAGIDMLHVPYKGASPLMQAVLSGEVQAAFVLTGGTTVEQLKSGKIKVLAVTGETRSRLLPGVPTFAEAGRDLREMDHASLWYGFFMPRGTSPIELERMHDALARATRTPRVLDALAREDIVPSTLTQADFARKVQRDNGAWGEVIRSTGFTLEE